ncbi:pyrroloquinoline quinone biosynthesis peptide chaperone PqqD [Amycolatopsis pigmentata]|uniref:Pyrroloquinoline quinone biosynthesis peptide chaperone PqqD n=1 Tax=Amycolatopsis pigmentata TaxID=450801 RepID=A0ABW5FXQ4_9PSEU
MPSTELMGNECPKLSDRVRLTFDPVREQHVLLSPETVTVLNPTAAAVLRLCDGVSTVETVVRELGLRYDRVVAGDVRGFLNRLAAKGYLEFGRD